MSAVALRKESVDRNFIWSHTAPYLDNVALRKESVDRNVFGMPTSVSKSGRSPQGERG